MKKYDLFELLDVYQRNIEQVRTINEILSNKHADILLSESHRRTLVRINADIYDSCMAQAETISKELTRLYITDDAVNGTYN